MQVASWLPRVELPFAAPSRPELLVAFEPEPEVMAPPPVHVKQPVQAVAPVVSEVVARERPRIEVPKPGTPSKASEPAAEEASAAPTPRERPAPPPRFALQLLRAGSCALLVELPTGEPFQSRDPAYLLLKDLLRAAGLPDAPQIIGEPVRWPLLVRGNMDQGPQAALDFVQSFIGARLEEQEPCACLWLIGLPAIRFAGDADAEAYNRELQVEELGAAWALPGLELLMDEPQRKRELWHAMQRVRRRWLEASA